MGGEGGVEEGGERPRVDGGVQDLLCFLGGRGIGCGRKLRLRLGVWCLCVLGVHMTRAWSAVSGRRSQSLHCSACFGVVGAWKVSLGLYMRGSIRFTCLLSLRTHIQNKTCLVELLPQPRLAQRREAAPVRLGRRRHAHQERGGGGGPAFVVYMSSFVGLLSRWMVVRILRIASIAYTNLPRRPPAALLRHQPPWALARLGVGGQADVAHLCRSVRVCVSGLVHRRWCLMDERKGNQTTPPHPPSSITINIPFSLSPPAHLPPPAPGRPGTQRRRARSGAAPCCGSSVLFGGDEVRCAREFINGVGV